MVLDNEGNIKWEVIDLLILKLIIIIGKNCFVVVLEGFLFFKCFLFVGKMVWIIELEMYIFLFLFLIYYYVFINKLLFCFEKYMIGFCDFVFFLKLKKFKRKWFLSILFLFVKEWVFVI